MSKTNKEDSLTPPPPPPPEAREPMGLDENMAEVLNRFAERVETGGIGTGSSSSSSSSRGSAEAAGGAFTRYLEAAKRFVLV